MIQQLKSWSKSLPYPVFLRLFYSVYALRELRRARQIVQKLGLPLLEVAPLIARKRSDVLFVLGSGSSINQITPDRWQAIARHDSLGLNFWVLHPFVPTFYFFESIEYRETPEAARVMLKAFAGRAADYRDTLKVAMEIHRRTRQIVEDIPAPFCANLYAALSIPAPARAQSELEYALTYLRRRSLFDGQRNYHRLFKYAASITTALVLAARLRYKRVVLCGVDLHDQKYFFQDPQLYPDTADLTFAPRTEPHDTNIALEWRLPLQQVLPVLKHSVLDPVATELYLENTKSALYPAVLEAPRAVFSAV